MGGHGGRVEKGGRGSVGRAVFDVWSRRRRLCGVCGCRRRRANVLGDGPRPPAVRRLRGLRSPGAADGKQRCRLLRQRVQARDSFLLYGWELLEGVCLLFVSYICILVSARFCWKIIDGASSRWSNICMIFLKSLCRRCLRVLVVPENKHSHYIAIAVTTCGFVIVVGEPGSFYCGYRQCDFLCIATQASRPCGSVL